MPTATFTENEVSAHPESESNPEHSAPGSLIEPTPEPTTDSAAEFTEAEQVADVSPRSQTTVTSHSEASPPTAYASNEPARPAHNPPQISNAHVIPGKAVGKENH